MIEYLENGDLALVDGLKFRKDKRTGYYLNRKTQTRLHRYIWEKYNGKIPAGYHVHHIDLDKSNNDINNLEIMTNSEHEKLHGSMLSEERKESMRKNLAEKARPAASIWHGSEAGREWHKAHYSKTKNALYKKVVLQCEYCGKEYEAINHGNNRFCSNNCKASYRRKSGVDNEIRECSECGKTFSVNKYSKQRCCSAECGRKSSWNKRHRLLRL